MQYPSRLLYIINFQFTNNSNTIKTELTAMLENLDISRQTTMEQFIFIMHTPNVTPHIECVSVVDKHFAVTYRHLDHQDYKKGQKITIQQLIDPEKEKVNVKVYKIREWHEGDFMLLRTIGDEEFKRYPGGAREAKPAEKYWIATPSMKGKPGVRFIHGIVKENIDDIFMSATTPGNQGDSGAGVYSEGCFIGMVVGNVNLIGDYLHTKFVNAYPSILKLSGKLDKEDPFFFGNVRGSKYPNYSFGYPTSYGYFPIYSPCPWGAHPLNEEPRYTPTSGSFKGLWKNDGQ